MARLLHHGCTWAVLALHALRPAPGLLHRPARCAGRRQSGTGEVVRSWAVLAETLRPILDVAVQTATAPRPWLRP